MQGLKLRHDEAPMKSYTAPQNKSSISEKTSVDFFSTPKQGFMKTRLSVNLFELKVNDESHHAPKSLAQQRKFQYQRNFRMNNNLIDAKQTPHPISQDQITSTFRSTHVFPSLNHDDRGAYTLRQQAENSKARNEESAKIFNNKSKIMVNKKKLDAKAWERESEEFQCTVSATETLPTQSTAQKTYFINNLSLDKEVSREDDSDVWRPFQPSIRLRGIGKGLQNWSKHMFTQSVKLKKIDKQLDLISKKKILKVPEPLKSQRLVMNPEQVSNRIRRKFRVNLTKKKHESEGVRLESRLGRWDTEHQHTGQEQF